LKQNLSLTRRASLAKPPEADSPQKTEPQLWPAWLEGERWEWLRRHLSTRRQSYTTRLVNCNLSTDEGRFQAQEIQARIHELDDLFGPEGSAQLWAAFKDRTSNDTEQST
jgi:hypothetical protein